VTGSGGEPIAALPPAEAVADEIGIGVLLRCWLRERRHEVPAGASEIIIDLPASGLALTVPVRYRSPCGWHHFGRPVLAGGARSTPTDRPAQGSIDAGQLAALLVEEAAAALDRPPGAGTDALCRMIDSVRRIAIHVRARRSPPATVAIAGLHQPRHQPEPPQAPSPQPPTFLAGEQALLAGHPFHPAAKSREGASETELAAYSPELYGSFQLHWFAAETGVAACGGSVPGGIHRALHALAPELQLPPATVPIPAHRCSRRAWPPRPARSPAASAPSSPAGGPRRRPAGGPWPSRVPCWSRPGVSTCGRGSGPNGVSSR
jgi:hypothetical protein